jgi:AcrR family transcriptional regulator
MSFRSVKPPEQPGEIERRQYRSPKRERASLATRRRIRAAAEELFIRDGYVRTTTRAIAQRAGVAEMTLFLAFTNKPALLSEIIRVNVRGDDDDTPISRRVAWQEILTAAPEQILRRFAEFTGQVQARTARVLAVAEAAATTDSKLASRRAEAHAHIRADFQQVADALAGHHRLAEDIPAARAADIIYALASESTYLLLVDERGWSNRQYVEWLSMTLDATLCDDRQPRAWG